MHNKPYKFVNRCQFFLNILFLNIFLIYFIILINIYHKKGIFIECQNSAPFVEIKPI